jgi:hypothetical protein
MKKALLFTMLSLFLCINFAFASSEAVGDVVFEGTIATLKDGFLFPATIKLQMIELFPTNTPEFFTGKLTIKADKDGKTVYNATFDCTGYYNETDFIVTTKGTAVLSGNATTGSVVLQIPAEGITGKFQF